MPRQKIQINFDEIHHSKTSGDYKIVEELPMVKEKGLSRRMVKVKFLSTGTELVVQLSQAMTGTVKDPYRKSVAGVACMGDLSKAAYTKMEYDMWRNMVLRCYDINNPSYYLYGGSGYTVCEEWLCFTNFLYDLPMLNGYRDYAVSIEKTGFHLNIMNGRFCYNKENCLISNDSNMSNHVKIGMKNNGTSSKYYGVYKSYDNSFQANITINSIRYYLGTYSNELAAASVYNYIAERCCLNPVLNNRSEMMMVNEAFMYLTSRTPLVLPPNIDTSILRAPCGISKPLVEMCRIVRRY